MLSVVSNILWQERQLLELLAFKLEEEQLVLASGRARWLAHATREVEMVLEEIRRAELDRSVHVEAVATELGLGPNPTLQQLATAAPAPWGAILEEHRKAFLECTQAIVSLAQVNRELLSKGYRAARETLAWLGHGGHGDPEPEVYSPSGTTAARSRSILLDEVI